MINMNKKLLEKIEMYKVDSFALFNSNSNKTIYYGKANKDTIFEAASLTKIIFCYLVIELSQDKLYEFSLDTPLIIYRKKYNVTFKDYNDKSFELICARHILSHCSGLENWSNKDILPMYFTPGEKFMYSGEGYQYLQEIICAITKKDIEALLNEYIFKPLNMRNSFIKYNEVVREKLINCYDQDLKICDNRSIENPNVAYSLYTTITDYKKFVSKCLLCENQINKEMYKKVILVDTIDNMWWDLGLANINDKYYWQWGDNGCFKNFLWIDKATNSFVLFFSNSYNGLDLISDLLNLENKYKSVIKIIK